MKLHITQKFEEVKEDILIVGIPDHPDNTKGWEAFVQYYHPQLQQWIKNNSVKSTYKKMSTLPAFENHSFQHVLFVGLGNRKWLTENKLRQVFSAVGKELNTLKANSIAIWTSSFTNEEITCEDVTFLASEGIGLGSYLFEDYKTSSNEQDVFIETTTLISEMDEDLLKAAFDLGKVSADAVNEARTLVNMPPNILRPRELANYAQTLAEKYGFEIEVLGKKEMEEQGMGAILAVNKGSVEEPQLITLKYNGTEQWEDVVGLVGKGITYDTGGYSLKPRDGMVGMKGDMGGAAAVLGAMAMVGETRPSKNVLAVIASTDNMISGEAFKPDDVITSLSGKTIEVLNTDAEGRLVLADAVTYAIQSGANYLVNVATLTGGVIVALGNDKTGALTNDEVFFEEFMHAATETGEFVWRLPLTESDRERIRKSDVADLNNSPGRDGHMIFGGGFVGEFVGNTPWIHLDIAGTSGASVAHDLGPKGATGVMVRTLGTLVERMAVSED